MNIMDNIDEVKQTVKIKELGEHTAVYVKEGKIIQILGVLNAEEVEALRHDSVHLLDEESIERVAAVIEKISEVENGQYSTIL